MHLIPLERAFSSALVTAISLAGFPAIDLQAAEKQYGPGVSDTEIKIGQTIAYSGPASSFVTTGHTISAFYRLINDRGRVNGRKINFISVDDGYSHAQDGRADPQAR